jgi:outer membrane protein OmpA-like peptidoglycan-associated protein
LLVGAFGLASVAEAQTVRPSHSVYLLLRGGATLYHGDIDEDSDDNLEAAELQIVDQFEDAGPSLGAEVGYQFDESLSFGVGYVFQANENFDVSIGPFDNEAFGGYFVRNDDNTAHQVRALFRYLPFPSARLTPVVEIGGAFVIGNGTESEREGFDAFDGADDDPVYGFGPVLGLGLDLALSSRFSVVTGLQTTLVFPDVALDGADPGVFGSIADDADYDILANLGFGLKYAFFDPTVPPAVTRFDCPGELVVGEDGTFTLAFNDDATLPVEVTWDFGDGAVGQGTTVTHAYDAPGTYTVTATATNAGGSDSESCLVTVVGLPPVLACTLSESVVGPGEQVTVDADVEGTEPIEISVDFGDGTVASTLPARHAYAEPGDYTVTITATNAYGSDTCPLPVTVESTVCDVTELNSVFFEYGSDALTADARVRLDENVEILRRCPEICVRILGYSDGVEPNALALAQARADAVRDYYVAQGIDADRLCPEGRGVDPEANPKEDPGPGDSRARRADSIPVSCAGFECDRTVDLDD